jgi:hypothetical protein
VNFGDGGVLGADGGKAVALEAYTGADGQLWRLEQFPDGDWRIRNKATGMSLTAVGAGGVAASDFVKDDVHLWTIATP